MSTILKNAERIQDNQSLENRKRKSESDFSELDECVLKWFKQNIHNKISISGPISQEKAASFDTSLVKPDFRCSNGSLDRFKKR